VHPLLMARASYVMTPFALMALLKKLATPFDFMRLPEELQLQVYRIVFQGHCNWVTQKFTQYQFPALLSASSQIRRVALPIYYGQVDFRVTLRSLEDLQKAKKWTANIAGPSLRFMRRMAVSVPSKYRYKSCGHSSYTDLTQYKLEWSPGQGLRTTDPPKADKSATKALEDKIKTTNAYAKAADCGGEAIILAISAMMTTWIPLHFRPLCKCKRWKSLVEDSCVSAVISKCQVAARCGSARIDTTATLSAVTWTARPLLDRDCRRTSHRNAS
jgi:hypothetical protein